VSCRLPATGVQKRPLSTRLKPALGLTFRQVPPIPRALFLFPGRSVFRAHNPLEIRVRRRATAPRPGACFVNQTSNVTRGASCFSRVLQHGREEP